MKPFIYSKTRHTRRQQPKQYRRYQSFKPYLQEEFGGLCVYCRIPDAMKGYDSFHVEHYRPKGDKRFKHLETVYTNLFYSCAKCNRDKGQYWPPQGLEARKFIPNPCDHAMFSHLRFNQGHVLSKSEAGETAIEVLDLNDPGSVQYREFVLASIDAHTEYLKSNGHREQQILARIKVGKLTQAVAQPYLDQLATERLAHTAALKRLTGEQMGAR